jgi:sterol desaturase/sphingolipid hydroxylase (fatty acid hydroxylase superfamily)
MTGTSLVLSRPHSQALAATPFAVQWFTWPALFFGAMATSLHAIAAGWTYGTTYTGILIALVVTLVTLEVLFPLRQDWRMTGRSFLRDLKYLAGGSVTITGVNALFGLAAIELGTGRVGPLTDLPLYVAVPAALLAFELIQYWSHRAMHELGGPLGRFLWKVHAAHHLPDRVYVFMHAAGHPLNGLIVRGFTMLLPLYYLGATAETMLLFNVIINVQGLISHCNVDLRAGWVNYIFAGTELHRYHHSADVDESKNYAVTLSLLDVLFGTFRYRPGIPPARLGVADPATYPESNQFWRVMWLPFARDRRRRTA